MADIGKMVQAILQMQKSNPAYTPPSYAPGTPTLEGKKFKEAIREFDTGQAESVRQFDISAGQKDQQLALEGIRAARSGGGGSTTLQKEITSMMGKIQADLSPKLDERGRPTGFNRFYKDGKADYLGALNYYKYQMSPEAFAEVYPLITSEYEQEEINNTPDYTQILDPLNLKGTMLKASNPPLQQGANSVVNPNSWLNVKP